MLITKPGIHKNISNDDYHKSVGISNSGIGELIDPSCPAMYYYKYLSGKYVRPVKQHFALGTAVHTLVLEPETFDSRYYVIEKKIGKQSNKGKLANELIDFEANGRDILTKKEHDQIRWMADNALRHPLLRTQLKNGCVEDSLLWEDQDTGALIRTRPDYYNEDFILDLKTTKDITAEAFSRAINNYGYHRQSAIACDGLQELSDIQYDTTVLFLIAVDEPYLVRAFSIHSAAIQKGRREYKRGAAIYQQCLTNNCWPGYPEIIEDISLPHWAFREDEEK